MNFCDIKLNDIITIEKDGFKSNFKIIVIHNNPLLSRIEVVGSLEDKVDVKFSALCLSADMIVNNVNNIITQINNKTVNNTIEHVPDLDTYKTLYVFNSADWSIKLININSSNISPSIKRENDFATCNSCDDRVYMAGPNQPDGSFICYSCRSNPIRIFYQQMKDGLFIDYNGNKFWYLNGKLHREDGPAAIHITGDKCWLLNGNLHREDGPAVEFDDGDKEWYYHGKLINCSSQEEFERLIKLKVFW